MAFILVTETGVQAFALTLKAFAKVAREANTVAKTISTMVASIGHVVRAGGKVPYGSEKDTNTDRTVAKVGGFCERSFTFVT